MNSKRFLALLLALILLMAGCGKQNEAPDNTTTEAIATTQAPATTAESLSALEDSEFDDETEPVETETQIEESTEPTQSVEPTETAKPTEPAKPEETTPAIQPTQPSANEQMGYEKFHNMSGADQQAYMGTFENLDMFFAWYNQAKAEYEAANPPIDVGNGSVDMGDLIG